MSVASPGSFGSSLPAAGKNWKKTLSVQSLTTESRSSSHEATRSACSGSSGSRRSGASGNRSWNWRSTSVWSSARVGIAIALHLLSSRERPGHEPAPPGKPTQARSGKRRGSDRDLTSRGRYVLPTTELWGEDDRSGRRARREDRSALPPSPDRLHPGPNRVGQGAEGGRSAGGGGRAGQAAPADRRCLGPEPAS